MRAFKERSKEYESEEDTVTFRSLNSLSKELNDTVAAGGMSKTKEQEITILRHEIKEQQKYINQYQLILDSLEEVTNKRSMPSSTISAYTSRKVHSIIQAEQAQQFFQNCPMDSHPLGLVEGVTPSRDSQLLYDESAGLRTAVEQCIAEKCNAMKISEKNELALSKQSIDKTNTLKLNAELDKAVLNYNESLTQSYNIMKEIFYSFVIPMSKINESRAECLEEELRATEGKAKLLECKVTKKMYLEDKNILPCIDKIDASLKLEMESVSLELKKCRIEKAKYDQLSESDKYQKVLTEYKELNKSIKDKKWLLRQC